MHIPWEEPGLHLERRNCYCRPDQKPTRRVPAGFCGTCLICDSPGHSCHHPGQLPFTGGWCDEHYEYLCNSLDAAVDREAEFGLRADRILCFRIPPARAKRFFIFPYQTDSHLLEFRSDWLARFITRGKSCPQGRAVSRWDHPLFMWIHPLEFMRQDDWEAIPHEDFVAAWRNANS